MPSWQCAGRLFFDLMNEPDAFRFTWSYNGTNFKGQDQSSIFLEPWGTLYTDTAALLLQQEPELLLFVEGTGQRNQPGTSHGTFLCRL